jgi:hypothetical protein
MQLTASGGYCNALRQVHFRLSDSDPLVISE